MARDASPGRWSGPQFERQVKQVFSDALFMYCGLAEQDPRVDPRRLRIRIQVVLGTAAQDTLTAEIRALVQQTLYRDLRGARLDSLSFPLDPDIGEPGYQIDIEPPLPGYTTDPGGLRHPPVWPPRRVDPVMQSTTALVFTYDMVVSWRHALFEVGSWLPLGRGLPDSATEALRIPNHVTPIPRGLLLELRYQRGDADLRRTYHRPDYVVQVDRVLLAPGESVVLEADGTIEYVLGRAPHSVLTYQLERKE